jgi:hypothetical protein
MSILRIVGDYVNERQQKIKNGGGVEDVSQGRDKDMLARFLEVQKTNATAPPW